MPGILPEMSIEASPDVTRIYSVADQLPAGTRVLEVMRQSMEDKVVTISHAKGSLTFSANFQLIAAMNPCPEQFIRHHYIITLLKRSERKFLSNLIFVESYA
jgi:hypothetical protein